VYGTLRWRRRLDFALAAHCHRPLRKVEPGLMRVLRMSAYQLLFLDRVPAWAVVDQATSLATSIRSRRVAGFVNGVLRGLAAARGRIDWPDPERDPAGALAVLCSFPKWLVERWILRFGRERAERLMTACNQPGPRWARANTLRGAASDLADLMEASGYVVALDETVPDAVRLSGGGDVTASAAHQGGHFHIQDAAAQAICHLLDPRPGQRVLDACGAPGGKTATIAQLMKDQGEIMSVDIHPARMGLVERNLQRLGISSVVTTARDLTQTIPPEWGTFDRILLDAPCSALGVLRRHPEGKWRLMPEDPPRLSRLQAQLLGSISSALSPGGRLVYSVCTPTVEEGPEVVEAFLEGHDDFERHDPRKGATRSWHSLLDGDGALSTWPDLHDMDAHYAVCMQKLQ
jgi:16S rRNA (cytosine967-C5)-methyltransferase